MTQRDMVAVEEDEGDRLKQTALPSVCMRLSMCVGFCVVVSADQSTAVALL